MCTPARQTHCRTSLQWLVLAATFLLTVAAASPWTESVSAQTDAHQLGHVLSDSYYLGTTHHTSWLEYLESEELPLDWLELEQDLRTVVQVATRNDGELRKAASDAIVVLVAVVFVRELHGRRPTTRIRKMLDASLAVLQLEGSMKHIVRQAILLDSELQEFYAEFKKQDQSNGLSFVLRQVYKEVLLASLIEGIQEIVKPRYRTGQATLARLVRDSAPVGGADSATLSLRMWDDAPTPTPNCLRLFVRNDGQALVRPLLELEHRQGRRPQSTLFLDRLENRATVWVTDAQTGQLECDVKLSVASANGLGCKTEAPFNFSLALTMPEHAEIGKVHDFFIPTIGAARMSLLTHAVELPKEMELRISEGINEAWTVYYGGDGQRARPVAHFRVCDQELQFKWHTFDGSRDIARTQLANCILEVVIADRMFPIALRKAIPGPALMPECRKNDLALRLSIPDMPVAKTLAIRVRHVECPASPQFHNGNSNAKIRYQGCPQARTEMIIRRTTKDKLFLKQTSHYAMDGRVSIPITFEQIEHMAASNEAVQLLVDPAGAPDEERVWVLGVRALLSL